ncbi:MAG TPA: hydantoinase B/oxoprolinase family protein [Geminicoccaceae bacterium]|nr:hydantoinase B/oxoprolinase family protein [Geminicoccaceae bacterium]
MTEPTPDLDPITLEILANALRSVTDETFAALMRSAYSTNIKERHDHSTTIMDRRGRLVVQAHQSLPIHLASMWGLMEALLAKYPEDQIQDGDLFVANDPFVAGGTHLPDVNMAMPVFADGALTAYVCNIAHHADIGGARPGSMAGGMSEIFQEGLRIPVVKLFRRGELQQDLLDLLLLNVRVPEERRGDYFAQIAASRLGARRLAEVIGTRGRVVVEAAFEQIIARTERRMREAIRALPDGNYRFRDVMDGDGLEAFDIPIAVEVTVSGDRIGFDFAGTSPQVPGSINVTLNATVAAVGYAVKALLDPEVPNNQGMLDVLEVTAAPGTLVNAVFPAPVSSRAHTSQRIIDVVLGALAPALPERAVAAANGANSMAVFAGTDPQSGRPFVYLETLGGGMGGRPMKDGKDGVQVGITNTSNLPVEAIELEYPLLVEEYSLIPDSGGAGTYRGGLGLRRVVRPLAPCLFNGVGERFRHRPWGLFGGQPGGSGQFLIVEADGTRRRIHDKPGEIRLGPEQALVVETPGAGGYGPPTRRSAEALAEDRASGKFSPEFMRRHYGRD